MLGMMGQSYSQRSSADGTRIVGKESLFRILANSVDTIGFQGTHGLYYRSANSLDPDRVFRFVVPQIETIISLDSRYLLADVSLLSFLWNLSKQCRPSECMMYRSRSSPSF